MQSPVKARSLFLLTAAAALASVDCQRTFLDPMFPLAVLDDGRRWLDTPATLLSTAPDVVQAAAAAGINQSSAERLLERILREQPASVDAVHAHMLLSRIYLRTGRYQKAIANLDEWARRFPKDGQFWDAPKLEKEKTDVEQFRGLPDQVNGPVRASKLRHDGANDFSAPIAIDGKPANYLLDTGAWMSVMTEREAKRLGLEIRSGSGMLAEASGKGVPIRTAVAGELTVGAMSFRQVSFAILPDVEPWTSMPDGRGGVIGIPVLLAMECMRWRRAGSWELGCASDEAAGRPNMVFFENHLLAIAHMPDARPSFTLDTGAETTDLNSNFAKQFSSLIERVGKKGSTQVTGAGGTAVIESMTIPDLAVDIGGTATTLRPANITMQKNAALGGQCCIGNLGLDLLRQTGDLTIDFRTMTLRLR